MATHSTGPWSSASHAASSTGMYRGRIESIKDPKGRNRVQIRLFGYQDDQGTIDKEQLEWVHAASHDSQVPGATSTHNYYPGAEVIIMDNGTEKFILGSVPGFDGEKRLKDGAFGVDSSDNQNADVPNINRKQAKDTTIRHSPGLIGAPGAPEGMSKYFSYQNWEKNLTQMVPYATGKGAPPAPWGEGDVSKQDQLQSIGLQKNAFGSDVLNTITKLDGNQSGAIKSAIQLIQNLRNNGFGNAMGVVGSGPFNAAVSQYSDQFGSHTQNNLINLLQQLLTFIQDITLLTPQNFFQNVQNNEVTNIITFLQNTAFNVSSDTLTSMSTIANNVLLSNNNGPLAYYSDQLTQFLSLFQHAVSQAFTTVITQITDIANSVNDISAFITVFGGNQSFTQFAQVVNSIGQYVGMPQTAINIIGLGSIGLALGGGLSQIPTTNQTQQPTNPSNSNASNNSNPLIGLMSMFQGNQIATKELLGGGLIKDFLSGNPKKYQQVDRNHGQSVLKRFPD